MAVTRPFLPLSLLGRGARRLVARVPSLVAGWQTQRAERRALLDVVVKRGDRLLDDAGLSRAEAERRLDVSRISPWDRWQL